MRSAMFDIGKTKRVVLSGSCTATSPLDVSWLCLLLQNAHLVSLRSVAKAVSQHKHKKIENGLQGVGNETLFSHEENNKIFGFDTRNRKKRFGT